MIQFNATEKKNATISFVINYKRAGMKEMVTHPISIRVVDLSDKESKMIMGILKNPKSYKSRKLIAKLNKETNGKQKVSRGS